MDDNKNFVVTLKEDELSEESEMTFKEKRQEKIKTKSKAKIKAKSKKEKGAMYVIVSLVCFVAVLTASLSLISVATDWFKEDDTVKTMALSSLSSQDAGELEAYFSRISILSDFELSDSTVSDEIYAYLKPESENGLYSTLATAVSPETQKADPYNRFQNEDGSYGYYKLKGEKTDEIVKSFGLVPNHTLNLKDAYYYGESYYIKAFEEQKGKQIESDVVSSKRIQDGSYYVECDFYSSGKTEGKEEGKMYAVVKKEASEDGSENRWIFKRISSTPLFDKSGIMLQNEEKIKFEMKRESFEGKLKDGTVFCEYTLEYPVFKGETSGEAAANHLYGEMLSKYKKSAEEADRYFKESKLKKNQLPLAVHISSKVTFVDEKYISTIVDISEYNPKKANKSENGDKSAVIPNRIVEGYIFDVNSSDYVSKDTVIGKDYRLISDLLYRIQGGYDYEDLLDENVSRPSGIPADDEIGKSFYESGSAICKNGYVFCRVTEKGYVEWAVLPNDVIKRITEKD